MWKKKRVLVSILHSPAGSPFNRHKVATLEKQKTTLVDSPRPRFTGGSIPFFPFLLRLFFDLDFFLVFFNFFFFLLVARFSSSSSPSWPLVVPPTPSSSSSSPSSSSSSSCSSSSLALALFSSSSPLSRLRSRIYS